MDSRLKAWNDGEWGCVSAKPQPARNLQQANAVIEARASCPRNGFELHLGPFVARVRDIGIIRLY